MVTVEPARSAAHSHNPITCHVVFAGKRRCLGEALARSCVFTFFTGVLQNFEILPVPGKELPGEAPMPGLLLSPQPYTVMLKPRVSRS
jgi:cytochrome P450